jgi:16S rRNA (guanine527-N7)-methyltransferase
MLDEQSVKEILARKFNFSKSDLKSLEIFVEKLLNFNQKYNLISKSTEKSVWERHILDSAQIIDYIEFENGASLSDFGTGAGFPGLILALYNKKQSFHVKLYEKSIVKCSFLKECLQLLNIKAEIKSGNLYNNEIDSEYLVFRAFKKLPELLNISRENRKKCHKMIILKGKNAQEEINKALKTEKFDYKLFRSITDVKSKIIVSNVIKY